MTTRKRAAKAAFFNAYGTFGNARVRAAADFGPVAKIL